MTKRKTLNTEFIMSLRPCSDWPEWRVREAVPETMSVDEFLRVSRVPRTDRIWVIMHTAFMTRTAMILFVCDCIEHVAKSHKAVLESLVPMRKGSVARRVYSAPECAAPNIRLACHHLELLPTVNQCSRSRRGRSQRRMLVATSTEKDAYAYAAVRNCHDHAGSHVEAGWQIRRLRRLMKP